MVEELQATPQLLEEIAAAKNETELSLQSRLRAAYSPELVRMAVTLSQLRQRATGKFSHASEMWFHRVGFEQSTAEAVAVHKANRFANADEVTDLCAGIGMDTIALAQVAPKVRSVDMSALASLYARKNSEVYGVAQRVESVICDVEEIDLAGKTIHIDPDRRAGKSRAIRLEDYMPGLEFLQDLSQSAAGGAIKLSPASNFGGKFLDAEIELVSLDAECKEATVWFGEQRSQHPWRATILPSGYTIAGDPLFARAPIRKLGKYLCDPDPALVRSGLIDLYCEGQNLARLDDAEEYLTSDSCVESPAINAFEVLDVLPNNDKEIRRYFRNANFGDVEIKCRHVPVNADKLRKKLTLNGEGRGTLIIARLQGKTKAVICRRVTS